MKDILKKKLLMADLYERTIPLAFEFNERRKMGDIPMDSTPRMFMAEEAEETEEAENKDDAQNQAEDMANRAKSEDWDVKGYMTVWEVEDSVGDVIDMKACDAWVEKYMADGGRTEYGGPLPMLFEHSFSDPVGYFTKFEKDPLGLMGYAKFYDTQRAKDMQTILKDQNNTIGGFSIRFTSDDYEEIEEDGQFKGYRYQSIALKETSLVMRPAQKRAKVMAVKTNLHEDGKFNSGYVRKTLREAGMAKDQANHVMKALDAIINPPELTEAELQKTLSEIKARNQAESLLQALKSFNTLNS